MDSLSEPGCSVERMFVRERLDVEGPDLVGIGDMAPGLELMGLLAGVDRESLSGFDRVEVLRARARLRAHLDAELLADMSGILDAEIGRLGADLEWGDVHDVAAAEIGAALCWTRRASEGQLGLASSLVSEYRPVWELLRAGLIDLPRARVIDGTHLPSRGPGQRPGGRGCTGEGAGADHRVVDGADQTSRTLGRPR